MAKDKLRDPSGYLGVAWVQLWGRSPHEVYLAFNMFSLILKLREFLNRIPEERRVFRFLL